MRLRAAIAALALAALLVVPGSASALVGSPAADAQTVAGDGQSISEYFQLVYGQAGGACDAMCQAIGAKISADQESWYAGTQSGLTGAGDASANALTEGVGLLDETTLAAAGTDVAAMTALEVGMAALPVAGTAAAAGLALWQIGSTIFGGKPENGPEYLASQGIVTCPSTSDYACAGYLPGGHTVVLPARDPGKGAPYGQGAGWERCPYFQTPNGPAGMYFDAGGDNGRGVCMSGGDFAIAASATNLDIGPAPYWTYAGSVWADCPGGVDGPWGGWLQACWQAPGGKRSTLFRPYQLQIDDQNTAGAGGTPQRDCTKPNGAAYLAGDCTALQTTTVPAAAFDPTAIESALQASPQSYADLLSELAAAHRTLYHVIPAPKPNEVITDYETDLQTAGINNVQVKVLSDATLDPSKGPDAVVAVHPQAGTQVKSGDLVTVEANPDTAPQPGSSNGAPTTSTGAQVLDPIQLPTIETPCDRFPFGVPCWIVEQAKKLATDSAPPAFTLHMPFVGDWRIDLGSTLGEDGHLLMSIVFPVILFTAFIGFVLRLAHYSHSGGQGAGGDESEHA